MLVLGFVKIWIPGTWTVGQEKRNPQPRQRLETTLTFFEFSFWFRPWFSSDRFLVPEGEEKTQKKEGQFRGW